MNTGWHSSRRSSAASNDGIDPVELGRFLFTADQFDHAHAARLRRQRLTTHQVSHLDLSNLICLCPKHHRLHDHDMLGIAGIADDPDGVVFSDARGSPIPHAHPLRPPSGLPACERAYEAPPAGRMNYDWVGLGWAHPNALRRRRDLANRWLSE